MKGEGAWQIQNSKSKNKGSHFRIQRLCPKRESAPNMGLEPTTTRLKAGRSSNWANSVTLVLITWYFAIMNSVFSQNNVQVSVQARRLRIRRSNMLNKADKGCKQGACHQDFFSKESQSYANCNYQIVKQACNTLLSLSLSPTCPNTNEERLNWSGVVGNKIHLYP